MQSRTPGRGFTGVAIDLSRHWEPFPTEAGAPDLTLDASDYPFTEYTAVLWVLQREVGRTPSDAAHYWSMRKRDIKATSNVVGDVTMTTMILPVGESYVFFVASTG